MRVLALSPARTTNGGAFMASDPKLIVRTVSRKAYLSKQAHANLSDLLGQLTWLWNVALHQRKSAWKDEQRTVGFYEQCNTLTDTRTDPAWSRFSVAAQRSVLRRLDRSYKAFFRKGGYPRFKSEHRGVRSFSTPLRQRVRTNGKWSWVHIKGVGRVRFRSNPPEGDIRLLRVVRTARRVKVQFVVERSLEVTPDPRPMVGIDMGVTQRAALSTGEAVPGVKLDHSELKRRHRRVAKAKRGSKNRRKRVMELRREYQRVSERERGVLHELTTDLVKRVSGSFAVEDLQIPNMTRNRHLSRSIVEQQWGAFVHMLSYKAESAGGTVVKVSPRNTSQMCHRCGWRPRESIGLDARRYRCGGCGQQSDRDVNAARNVLQRAVGPNPGGAFPGRAEQEDQRMLAAASA